MVKDILALIGLIWAVKTGAELLSDDTESRGETAEALGKVWHKTLDIFRDGDTPFGRA